jgi:integrase
LAKSAIREADFSVKEISQGSTFSIGKDVGSHDATVIGKGLNSFCSYDSNRQLCVSKKAKKLEPQTELKTVAGEENQDVKGKIVEFLFHCQKEGLAPATLEGLNYKLTKMAKHADLNDPESVKEYLANLKLAPNTVASFAVAYGSFLKFQGKTWKAPKYTFQQPIPFIPLETEIDQLIAGCGKTTAAILQTLKETGMRIGEALKLKWTDLNPQNNTIILNVPEKHGKPRMFKVSAKLIGILQALPKKNDNIFGHGRVRDKEHAFQMQRQKIAQKISNPRLTKIRFHTLRHWKGTMEYHKTHDPDHVKRLLGHRNLQSTEVYINMEQAIFSENDQEFHVKVASGLEEACKLLEVGFEYVCDMDNKKLFRKRK